MLFLRYEDLLADLEGVLRTIIAFCGFGIAPGRMPTILERCRFAFMKQHESQFDPSVGAMWEQGVHGNEFLRKGRTGDWRGELSPEQAARFERAVDKHLGPAGIDLGLDRAQGRLRESPGTVDRGRESEPPKARRPSPVLHPPPSAG